MTEAEKFLENIKRAKIDYCKKHGLPIPEFKSESDFYISDEEWLAMKGEETPSNSINKGGLPLTRRELLDSAISKVATRSDREDTFPTIARLWSAYLAKPISESDVCALMILLKVARLSARYSSADSLVDIAGYAACAAEYLDGNEDAKKRWEDWGILAQLADDIQACKPKSVNQK